MACMLAVGLLAACSGRQSESRPELNPAPADQLEGTVWTTERILGKPAYVAQSVLDFRETGQVGGNTGCNGFHGTVTIAANNMRFGPLASTRRMCAPAINGQETVFLEALELTRKWNKAGNVLELLDANGTVVMILIRN